MTAVMLECGSRVWLEGQMWTVREVSPDRTLLDHDSQLRAVSIRALVQEGVIQGGEAPEPSPDAPLNVLLSSLPPRAATELRARVSVVRSLTEDSDETLAARLARVSASSGVATRTLERWIADYREGGPAGLVNSRHLRGRSTAVDPRWDEACLGVLRQYVTTSTPTKGVVLDRVELLLSERYGDGVVPSPSRATAYRRLTELSKGRHAFGSGKARRSVAERPEGPYGRLRATRPGEYVVLDTTPLDVFAMEPVTLRWVPTELTIAMDLYDRNVLGMRLTAGATTAADVANVLYQCMCAQPRPEDDGQWPFHGVPSNVLIGTEEPDGVSQERVAGLPACFPETIVVDHGKTYLSDHVISACARLGISIQPALPHKPTDKPNIERFFRRLREELLQHLPAYKGPDVFNRGAAVEKEAFLYVGELERVIREWIGTIYHHSKHDGLCVPEIPGMKFSPAEMFEIGLAKTGGLPVPSDPDLAFLFLDVRWRTIQHYGVELDGRRYDGPALNPYRARTSEYGGKHAGKWPLFVDVHDVRRIWFQDPVTQKFAPLEWEHAPGLDQPFSRQAAEYTKQIALRTNRHVDPGEAVRSLLEAWSKDEVTARRDRILARKLASTRQQSGPEEVEEPSAAVEV